MVYQNYWCLSYFFSMYAAPRTYRKGGSSYLSDNVSFSMVLSYMTYLPLDHYIIKIILFQIMLNITYIFLILILF